MTIDMHKIHQRLPFTSVFASKGFVVALCAAIAMVLGAMSVGTHTPGGNPIVTSPPPISNRTGLFFRNSTDIQQGQPPTSIPLERSYLSHQKPVLITTDRSGSSTIPLTSGPAKNLEVKLNLIPLESSIQAPSATLLLEVNEPLLTPVPLENSEPTELTVQDSGATTEETDVPPQTAEQDTSSSADVPASQE
jgi:hypothetical protein